MGYVGTEEVMPSDGARQVSWDAVSHLILWAHQQEVSEGAYTWTQVFQS